MDTILQIYVNANVAYTKWPFIKVISHFSSFFIITCMQEKKRKKCNYVFRRCLVGYTSGTDDVREQVKEWQGKRKGYRGIEENNFKPSIIGDLKDSRRAMIGRYNVITGMLPMACSGLIVLQVCTEHIQAPHLCDACPPASGIHPVTNAG